MLRTTSGTSSPTQNHFLFLVGDYATGAAIGAVTAVAVRAMVGPKTDMVIAMLVGMGVGMVVHLALGILMTPLLGMFHTMIPGGLIGMYGGMLFAMRDSMQAHANTLIEATTVGAAFGAFVIAALQLYNAAIRGPIAVNDGESGPEN